MADHSTPVLRACIERVDRIVAALIELVRQCDPLDLLSAVFWHMCVRCSSVDPAPDLPKEDVEWIWTLSYVQNLVAAIPATSSNATLDPDESALKARTLVGELTQSLVRYLFEWADTQPGGAPSQPKKISLEFLARQDWLHMRRSRFPRHDAPFLQAALSPHDEVLGRCFGVNAAMLAAGLDRQVNYHTFPASLAMARHLGIVVPGEDFRSVPPESQTLISYAILKRRDDPDLPRDLRRAAGETYCDFGAISQLPASLLDALSWQPGGQQAFLAPGEFRGWPLRLTPIHQRPLIHIQGRYFCFDSNVLSTMLYRCMYWAIHKLEQGYSQLWADRQRIVCEEFAATWFQKVLPGAEVLCNYYVDEPRTNGATKTERDVLVRYDDVLIFAECKAGNFGILPPATHFQIYRKSLENLVKKPFEQSTVNKALLERGELVVYKKTLEDNKPDYEEIRRFKKEDFRVIICCGVMLESFPGPAACEASLQVLLQQDEAPPFWIVAVEDLLACEDLFESPTTLLNFLQWRTRPGRPMTLAMEELDYVWAYLEHLTSGEDLPVASPGMVQIYKGGTEAIARKYWREDRERDQMSRAGDSLQDPTESRGTSAWSQASSIIELTSQRADGLMLDQITNFLDTCDYAGRARIAATLNSLSGPERVRLVIELGDASRRATDDHVTLIRTRSAAMLIIVSPERLRMLDLEARTIGLQFRDSLHTGYFARDRDATIIKLTINRAGRLGDMRWLFLGPRELL